MDPDIPVALPKGSAGLSHSCRVLGAGTASVSLPEGQLSPLPWLQAGRSNQRAPDSGQGPESPRPADVSMRGRAPGTSMCDSAPPPCHPRALAGVSMTATLASTFCAACHMNQPQKALGPWLLFFIKHLMQHCSLPSPCGLSIPISTCVVLVGSEADPDPFRPHHPHPGL